MPKRSRPACFDKATELLARRAHFVAELQAKLQQRSYPEPEVAATLEKLSSLGYLDDEKNAREFARSRLRRAPMGRRRLAMELSRKGVDSDVIEDCIEHLIGDDELALARRATESWLRGRTLSPAALSRRLDRRGFESRVILDILAERQ